MQLTRSTPARFARALLPWLLCGCGDPYGDFADSRNRIYCEAIFRCCDAAALAKIDPRTADQESCVTALDGRLTTVKSGIKSGALAFDSAASTRCLGAMKAAYANCDAPIDRSAFAGDCARVVGGISHGGACVADIDCPATDYCNGNLAAGPSGSGTGRCQPRAASAASCSAGQCALDLTCLPRPRATCGAFLDEQAICESSEQCKSGICAAPCVMSAGVVTSAFCPSSCDPSGGCLEPCSDPGAPQGMCPSLADRCAPLPTVRAALCSPPAT